MYTMSALLPEGARLTALDPNTLYTAIFRYSPLLGTAILGQINYKHVLQGA